MQLSKVWEENIRYNAVAILQQNCNRIATTYFATSHSGCKSVATELQQKLQWYYNETVADLLQICNGIATTLAYSLSFDCWDLAIELAIYVKFIANPLVFCKRMPKIQNCNKVFLQHNCYVANLLLKEICNGFLWICNEVATEKSVAKL